MNNDPKTHTALSKHQWNNSHNFNFDKVTILSNEKNCTKRITKEMLFINKNVSSANERTETDVDKLSIIFRNI